MPSLIQNSTLADEQRNTVKVAVLKGDSSIKDSVAISFYDFKPVYFLSSVIPDAVLQVRLDELDDNKIKSCQIYE